MEKRVFLAIILSFLRLAVFQTYVIPPPAPAPAPIATPVTTPQATQPALTPPGAPEAGTTTPLPATVVGDTSARDIVVETDTLRAVFTTEGATLKSWRLKSYYDV